MTINRQIPGPPIHVCQNDLIVVDVKNEMQGTSTTIHWHGFHQRETPFYDGVPFVTQCPIQHHTTFRYSFWATEAGTQWYHAHTAQHELNGLYGGIVVRRSDAEEPNRRFFDEDLPEHLIVVSDWTDVDAETFIPGLNHVGLTFGLANNMLINGRGVRRGKVSFNSRNKSSIFMFNFVLIFRLHLILVSQFFGCQSQF